MEFRFFKDKPWQNRYFMIVYSHRVMYTLSKIFKSNFMIKYYRFHYIGMLIFLIISSLKYFEVLLLF